MKIRELTAAIIKRTCYVLSHFDGVYLSDNDLLSNITNLNDSEFMQFTTDLKNCGLKLLVRNNNVAIERIH